ncbi:replication-associated recombination protein A [Photobacterium angustum]|uniref:Replication-associated recombination protein A n=1 Tax=Photobacterium angustum TaxID=661 RepID=A0A2T3M206_PHOAN|nr:recombination factor protein RarA [Photobacterium damselae subsp. damselae]KJF95589.1 recombination factor protein RarA [Photobacterium angustum]PSV28461.1 replication-associated recombination protein A [Photobacterium sp. GB-56]PSV32622.1 replication-associated recombination protein A [Photobacterium sp. GB-72]PSV38958.1 replication-associated recombination protein A [Photobacterium sp. GB-27]PSV40272.1 replication-associated recombination protein A [Photobacterium sp. GB-210]PSV47277.1 r
MNNFSLDFSSDFRPLAARMRPRTVEEYIGQQHILGQGKPLRRALEGGQLHSMILWGPPGTGKTTLAEVAAHYANAEVERVSAVTSGIKDIRAAIDKARDNKMAGRRTILFVDEVHRFNKSQQDAFLPHIEDGTVTFIGATTENPSFELNNALLSRARVYKLKSLEDDEILQVIEQALTDKERGVTETNLHFADDIKEKLAEFVRGDARMSLNYLEQLIDMAEEDDEGIKQITVELLAEVTGEKVARFDNKGDLWYDMISAVHKSIRGSNPDGALYWFARMLQAGCDPLYVARRLLAIASEDIGNADPRAMQVAVSAWDCYTRVGAYEGERAIAQAIVYLACAAKSNAVYVAFNLAKADAREFPDFEVPHHLRNAPTKLMKELGYGEGYRYAHDEAGAYAAGEVYLPREIRDRVYYQPSNRGLEMKISEKLDYLASLDAKSPLKRYQ